MIALLRSEFLKFRTVRLHVWLPLGAVGALLLVTGLVGIFTGEPESFDGADLMSLIGGFSVLVAMMVGVVSALGVTSEFAYSTIRPTLAATPQRSRVFIAKALITVAVGLVIGLVAVVAAYAVGNVVLSGRDAPVGLSGDDGSMAAFFGVPVLTSLLALFGYGVGLVLRSSPAAVSLIILWPLLIENIIAAVLSLAGIDDPTRLLPYSSAFALVIPDTEGFANSRLMGGLYFGLVALAITVVGALVNNRRDV